MAAWIADLLVAKLPDRDADDLRRRVTYVHNIVRGAVIWSILPVAGELNPQLRIVSPGFAEAALAMALAYLDIERG